MTHCWVWWPSKHELCRLRPLKSLTGPESRSSAVNPPWSMSHLPACQASVCPCCFSPFTWTQILSHFCLWSIIHPVVERELLTSSGAKWKPQFNALNRRGLAGTATPDRRILIYFEKKQDQLTSFDLQLCCFQRMKTMFGMTQRMKTTWWSEFSYSKKLWTKNQRT